MTVAAFDSAYAETVFSLLRCFSVRAEARRLGASPRENAEFCDIFILNSTLPGNWTGNALECEIAVVDSDDARVLRCVKKARAAVVTYGFNSKASVTVSGVTVVEPPFMLRAAFCLRRAVKRLDGEIALQQEFVVDTCGLDFEKPRTADMSEPTFLSRCLLPAVTAAVVAGKTKKQLTNEPNSDKKQY